MTTEQKETRYTIIGKQKCVWCDRAKRLLTEKGFVYDYTELNATNVATYALLMQKAGLTTVPQIWYGETYIGGYEDLAAFIATDVTTPE